MVTGSKEIAVVMLGISAAWNWALQPGCLQSKAKPPSQATAPRARYSSYLAILAENQAHKTHAEQEWEVLTLISD